MSPDRDTAAAPLGPRSAACRPRSDGLRRPVREPQARLEARPAERRGARARGVIEEQVLRVALQARVAVGELLEDVEELALALEGRADERVGWVRLVPELGAVDRQAARDAPGPGGPVERGPEAPDREHVDDVPARRHARRRPVGVVGEAVRLHLLEVATAPRPDLLEALVHAEPLTEEAERADHLRGRADRRELSHEDLGPPRRRRPESRDAERDKPPVDAGRLRARADEEDVVRLVPDRPVRDGREPAEDARVAAPHGAREGGELGRADLVVVAPPARGGPAGSIGGERQHHAEAHRDRPRDHVVVGLEARIGGGVGGREPGLLPGAGAGRDLRPLDLDPERVGAEGLDRVERLLPDDRPRSHERGVVLEHAPLRLRRMRRRGGQQA